MNKTRLISLFAAMLFASGQVVAQVEEGAAGADNSAGAATGEGGGAGASAATGAATGAVGVGTIVAAAGCRSNNTGTTGTK